MGIARNTRKKTRLKNPAADRADRKGKKALLRRLLKTSKGNVLIFTIPENPLNIRAIFDDGKKTTQVAYIEGTEDKKSKTAIGLDVFTAPEFREVGVTTAMIRMFEQQAKMLRLKFSELKAVIRPSGDKVQRRDTTPLLRKMGYKIEIPAGEYIGKGKKKLR